MHSNKLTGLLAASMIALAASGSAQTLDFTFSFTNTIGSVDGTVTGEVYGLTDNATGPATGVVVTSFPAGLNSLYGSGPIDFTSTNWVTFYNSFTVTDGQLTTAIFYAGNTETNSGLAILSGFADFLELDDQDTPENGPGTYYTEISGPESASVFTSTATPEPSTMALVGLGAVVGLVWRKRKS